MARSTIAAIPRIASLITRADITFSDSLVVQTVYLAISPLFVSEPNAKKKGKTAAALSGPIGSIMKTIRMEAMGCLRAVSLQT